ncbi:hypothetical protein GCM10010254_28700 [Streptomyces chromofuscus]|nr:hypothetical protein GCM10010254_28700 [Streptomyces chromofuscus]
MREPFMGVPSLLLPEAGLTSLVSDSRVAVQAKAQEWDRRLVGFRRPPDAQSGGSATCRRRRGGSWAVGPRRLTR